MEAFYHVEPVSERLLAIKSLNGEFVYLILGDSCALLIDTCVGVGNLRKFVENLTDLPITVALTHGHIDHAMGAPEFENVYLNPTDIPIYQRQCSKEERMGYLIAGLGDELAQMFEHTLVDAAPDYLFKDLEDGQTFDLGGIRVSAYAFPGHTPGMMAFLIEEEEILILGDACNNSTFLFDDDTVPVETYQKAVCKAQLLFKGRFKKIFISHHEMQVDINIMSNMIDVCQDIMDDTADDLPFHFMGMDAVIAKECDKTFHRTDGKDGNLIYRKDKIFAKEDFK
ncbi:MBL fold metallo-hydrolase [Streptococcus sp. S784/96/1]|uniref:MBL fold metallo-hydrolase n=1 Tax=Streptococcus sp. S784/96/1 TaxID=2653499 RepID=UPI001389E052|nr:MBL fold metallo-hydrolase [Streptococcus sp. S784/96/1]